MNPKYLVYSHLLAMACGAAPKQGGVDSHIIKPTELKEIDVKIVPMKK